MDKDIIRLSEALKTIEAHDTDNCPKFHPEAIIDLIIKEIDKATVKGIREGHRSYITDAEYKRLHNGSRN